MPRNVELIQKQFGSNSPLPSIELAYNALKLNGIAGNLYALKTDLNGEVEVLLNDITALINDLELHKLDDTRHLTPSQISKINSAINAVEALKIANEAIEKARAGIISEAVEEAEEVAGEYTDGEIASLEKRLKKEIGNLQLPTVTDPDTGEETEKSLADTMQQSPQNIINAEYFYRFKNMIDNSSFEVFDGITKIPYAWDNGVVSAEASMFGTYSLHLTAGETARQTSKHCPDVTWMKGAYDTDDVILSFYHKYDAVGVKIYDVVNEEYLQLTALNEDLSEGGSGAEIEYPSETNWDRFRCMLKFTPTATTKRVRVEFICKSGTRGCYIDGVSMEPYSTREYPSIYKDGRYSVSAYQLLNPPPADVDRFTALEHLDIETSMQDDNGEITYQKLVRSDGSTAIIREASNPDENGRYKTIKETFYKQDGTTINYVDTYSFTYSSTGAILTQTRTTTEEAG